LLPLDVNKSEKGGVGWVANENNRQNIGRDKKGKYVNTVRDTIIGSMLKGLFY